MRGIATTVIGKVLLGELKYLLRGDLQGLFSCSPLVLGIDAPQSPKINLPDLSRLLLAEGWIEDIVVDARAKGFV
jgi:hypothetical protein